MLCLQMEHCVLQALLLRMEGHPQQTAAQGQLPQQPTDVVAVPQVPLNAQVPPAMPAVLWHLKFGPVDAPDVSSC